MTRNQSIGQSAPFKLGCAWVAVNILMILTGANVSWAAPPFEPLPAPDYSFDLSSPSVDAGYVTARDILVVSYPFPISVLAGDAIGLFNPLDDINAMSSANANIQDGAEFSLLFSVDRTTVGNAEPEVSLIQLGVPYNASDQSGRGHAAGDQYLTTDPYTTVGAVANPPGGRLRNNVLSRNNFDEGGTDLSAYPATHAATMLQNEVVQDRVDAMAALDRRIEDESINAVYFSVTPGSPSMDNPVGGGVASGANVFVAVRDPLLMGACCDNAGGCTIDEANNCFAEGNFWMGPFTTCDLCTGPVEEGACCFGADSCVINTIDQCAPIGTWLGPGTTCELCEEFSVEGACCLPDETCEVLTDLECFNQQGFYFGPNADCGLCEQLSDGACCELDGSCQISDAITCANGGGAWLGPNSPCEACAGPGPGACCRPGVGCETTSENDCWNAGGIWLGPATPCELCDQPGLGGQLRDNSPGAASPITDQLAAEPPNGGGVAPYLLFTYASFAELGLMPPDDIDALIVFDRNTNNVFDGNDKVIFSLTPGSPSLIVIQGASLDGAAADLFIVSPGGVPALYTPASELGLGAPEDNIDALMLYQPESTQVAEVEPVNPADHGIRESVAIPALSSWGAVITLLLLTVIGALTTRKLPMAN